MKPGTLAIIIIIVAATSGLLFLSNHYATIERQKNEEAIRQKNVLQIIIDSTRNQDPFFNSSLQGKTIVINIWAAQYPPCRNQIPDLNKLVTDFGSDKIVFVALSPTDSTKAMSILKEHDLQFNYHLLFRSRAGIISQVLYGNAPMPIGFQGRIPTNIVISPQGGIQLFYTENDPDPIDGLRNYLAAVTGKGL